MLDDHTLDQLMQRGLEVLCFLQLICILLQAFRNCGVQHDICAGNAVGGAKGTELELISGKCEW